MELHNMQSTVGSRHKRKRVGRGDKTATRGENGQKSRSGYKTKIGFEGGQNPLYRRIPKRGFTNIHATKYSIVNIESLNKIETKEISPEILVEKGIIKSSYQNIKILGNGEIKKAMTIKAHKFSVSAKSAIEKAGGKIIIITNDLESNPKNA